MLIKSCTVSVKAAGPDDGLEDGQFTAYASVFGNVDSMGDMVLPGAFAEDLAAWEKSGDPIPLLWGHDFYDPFSNIGHIVEAQEDDRGLLVRAQLDLESPKAAQVYRLLKGRRVREMSFAYDILERAIVEKDDQRYEELKKLHVHEVSVVPLGANSETEVLAVKALAADLVAGVKAGRVLSAKNESALRTAYDQIGEVLAGLDSSTNDSEKASGPDRSKAADVTSTADDSRPSPSVDSLAALDALDLELSA